MDHQKRSTRSKSLTTRDYQVLAVTFGFGENVHRFIEFANLQQDKADHPERILRVIDDERRRMPPSRRPMVYGSGRA
jgi:hypothetical protein